MRGIRLVVSYRANLIKTNTFSTSSNNCSEESMNSKTKVEDFKKEATIDLNTTLPSYSMSADSNKFKYLKTVTLINRIFQSTTFTMVGTLTMFVFHILIWLTVALIEDQYYPNKRLVMTNNGMFNIKGCYSNGPAGIVIMSFVSIYTALDLMVILVLIITTEKDTYRIKVELIILACSRLFLVITYFIASQVQLLRIVSRIVPNNLIFLSYAFVENIVSIMWPVLRETVQKHEDPQVLESEIESILNNDETFKILLDFARRSFCPESVLFYKDVQHYKKLVTKYQHYTNNSAFKNYETVKKNHSNIQKFVLYIVNCYLSEGGINELNLPNVELLRNDITVKINEQAQGEYSIDLFNVIQVESLLTLLGLYERLKMSNKTIQEFSKSWTSKTNAQV